MRVTVPAPLWRERPKSRGGRFRSGEPGAERAGDLEGSPPAFVLTAGFDPLRDEAEAYCEALREAGVEAECRRYAGAIHGFWRWLAVTKLSRAAVDEVAGALRARLA